MFRKCKPLCLLLTAVLLAAVPACGAPKSEYTKYSATFMDAFDTVIEVMGYAKSEKEFNTWAQKAQDRFVELDHLYDIYHNYDGIHNVKTINDNAGKGPVKVEEDIINLLLLCQEWAPKAPGYTDRTNIALGSVLTIWHQYREAGIADPEHAQLPPMEDLQAAARHTDMADVVVDRAAGTVELKDPALSLDVGTVAKGYATELVAQELKAAGWTSFLLSAGGNVRAVGKPLDGVRQRWGVGIANPDNAEGGTDADTTVDTVFCNDLSVVTSGDYERYYVVDGKRYSHIIDPDTLLPATYFRSVTIVTEDSGLADYLDTILFTLPYEKGRAYIETLDGVDALWIFPDGTVKATDNLIPRLKVLGGASSK